MPTFRVTAPDGTTYDVTGPEGSTAEQAMAQVRSKVSAAPTLKEPQTAGERIATGLADPIYGGAQLLTKMLPDSLVKRGNALNNWLAEKTGLVAKLPEGGVDQQVREREAGYQAARGKNAGIDWLRLLGNIASPANLAIAAAGPAAAVGLGARVASGAAMGAGAGALSPVADGDFTEEKLKQVGMGLLGGGLTPVAAAGIGRLVSPKASVNPSLDLLRKEGVYPTVGQSMGGRMGVLEEKMTSLPIMGDSISIARSRSLEQFNKAALNRVVGKVGESIDNVGHDGVAQAAKIISNAYDDAAKMVTGVKFDAKFQSDLTQLRGMARSLVPDMRRKFDSKLKDVVGGRTSQANAMLPETFKKVDSEIGGLAAKYERSTVASEQELGDAFRQMQALLREQAARTNPDYAGALKNANAGYANLVRVEGAAKAAKNHGGIFTPAQLNSAIQAADSSVRKRAVAQGGALMQDLANAGQSALGSRVPNSFTADRALLAGGGLGAALINPMIPAGLILGGGAYTPPAQALLRGLVATRPAAAKSVARILNQASPAFAPAGGLFGVDLLDQ